MGGQWLQHSGAGAVEQARRGLEKGRGGVPVRRQRRQKCARAARHTFASHLVMRNVPLKAVKELLGHASITKTLRYAHLAESAKRDAVMNLDKPPPRLGDGARWALKCRASKVRG
ncbi:MAG: tyrosine-type recombinase/integrase [Archangium sp.]|nr:tyrosine-type recombinase/integrase [Archangium sp.]